MDKTRFFAMTPLALAMVSPQNVALAAPEKTTLAPITVQSESKKQKRDKMLKLKDSIVHTEVITQEKIEKKQAGSLTQAIENEPGVKVSTDCSLCGVKRVMLNGLKGEHTTLMINGVPNSSIMEGFYGYDAIPMAGVTSVEIARGAGASLIAPEAIGGVINVVTAKPTDDRLEFDLSQGNQDYRKYQIVGTKVSEDKDTALFVSAQSDNRGQVDEDDNWVNESPSLENRALVAQVWLKASEADNLDFRLTDQRSEVFGGPMVDTPFAASEKAAETSQPGTAAFVDNNINNRPDMAAGASPRDFLENIVTTKQAYTGKWQHEFSPDLQTQVTGSYVDITMDSIYEGITYKADQDIYYVDARADYFLNETNALTFGVDLKDDTYRSESTGGTLPANDSYDLNTYGAYIRDIWTASSKLEVSLALRADNVNVDFVDQDRHFNETIVAPRLHIRYDHNFNWTSRFSAGQGYRVPLAFFETDHGIVDDGFSVGVDQLEKSNSAQYSLAYNGARTTFETSYTWTAVENLAMLETIHNIPTLVNSPDTGTVQHADVSATYQLTGHWSVGGTVEGFFYDKNYRDTFTIIPVEQRVRLMADYEGHGWEFNATATWIGERDYKDYSNAAYDQHYDDKANTESKGDHSPAYYTVDVRIAKSLGKHWKVYAGANNLLDYTQTGEGDSPLFYDTDGNVDVTHIWGPLRGRLIYGGINAKF